MRRTNRIGTRIAAAALLAWACVTGASAGVLVTPGGVRFTYEAPNARSVSLAGTLNDWNANANPMVQEAGGVWSTVVRLDPGTYEYKFVVDGQWVADPENGVTVGDYGNSALVLGDDGRIAEMEATSNTEYSAKIKMEGRSIATYRSIQNPDNGQRYELDRPNLDTDIGFRIRVNDALTADVLTNINNESDVELYRTRLNFDRGILDFQEAGRRIRAWDNYDVGTWEDPLHLVGDVGIYSHVFGLGTQGVVFEESRWGWSGRFLYADDFADGNTAAPAFSSYYSTVGALGNADSFEFWELQPDDRLRVPGTQQRFYDFNHTSSDEDVMAGRASGTVGPLSVGLSARLDRGYNPSVLGVTSELREGIIALSDSVSIPGRTDTVLVAAQIGERTLYQGTEQWHGVGLDVAWPEVRDGMTVRTEALWGRAQFSGRTGTMDRFFLATLPESLVGSTRGLFSIYDGDSVVTADELDAANLPAREQADSRTFDLDESWRFFFGLDHVPGIPDTDASASVEVQTRDFESVSTGLADGISNRMIVYRLDLARPVTKRVSAHLAVEAFDFRYDRKNPWENQFWFDYRNFWLENDEHVVSFDRLVMLGDDAIFWRPSVDVEVWESPRIRFSYDGTFAQTGITREPKYTETLLKASWLVRPQWELLCDLRFVKYNDRILDLNDAYNETYLELKHEIAKGVEIALSYGVDPWVIDDPVNEYAYIGRDLFLFDRGANAETARDDFYGLAQAIRGAESALEAARVLQVEAMMRF
ncbi:glycogen-binding domain-containing protein [bacterium]|nr:glycogen-binding domain-containing protein [bacterium]